MSKIIFILLFLWPAIAVSNDRTIIEFQVDDNYPIHHIGPRQIGGNISRPCFPFGCGGISGPYINPSPRSSEEMPACYYDAQGKLFYARDSKLCSKNYIDKNILNLQE